MFKIAIVDDEKMYSDVLKSYLDKYQKENDISFSIDIFESGLALMSNYEPIYNVLFIDIEMPHMNGIELAKFIRKSDTHTFIFFVTNMIQYAVKGYEVNAVSYISKPVAYENLALNLDICIENIKSNEYIYINVPGEYNSKKILSKNILFIEVKDHWLHIYTEEETYKLLGSLNEMREKLAPYNFIKCNKSYLINLKHVTKIKSDVIEIYGDHTLKLSRSRKKEVQEAFMNYYS